MTDETIVLTAKPSDVEPDSVAALVGDEDIRGILDRYTVLAFPAKDPDAKPLIVWRCSEGCGDGAGHVGIIARNLDGDQTNLTLGEMVDAALRHAEEEHDENYGLRESS